MSAPDNGLGDVLSSIRRATNQPGPQLGQRPMPPPPPFQPPQPVGMPPVFAPQPLGVPAPRGGGPDFQPSGLQAPPAPAPAPAPAKREARGRDRKVQAEAGQIAENIPRSMRVGKTERVEIRIGKADAKSITEGLDGGGVAWRHDVTVTQAMSVRLRAPEGGFFIETVSPETQWIENHLGFASDDFASWRFLITPQSRGWARLQIVVSARTIGADGLAAETALPDQVVEVKVRTNFKRTFLRWAGWILAAVAGGALAKFGEAGLDTANTLVQQFLQAKP
jgi:neural Wiskott-Aldrich syndrome protein